MMSAGDRTPQKARYRCSIYSQGMGLEHEQPLACSTRYETHSRMHDGDIPAGLPNEDVESGGGADAAHVGEAAGACCELARQYCFWQLRMRTC